MSSYKELTNSPAYNFVGENKWDTKTPSNGWALADGSVFLINGNEKLFEKVGTIQDLTSPRSIAISSNTVSNINSLVYANSTFVYAGNGGVLATSPDFNNWTPQTSGTVSNINALTYGNNTFVYAGNGGVIGTSTDGTTWTARTSDTTTRINDLEYGNNTFVYVGDSGVIGTSTDGTTWSKNNQVTPIYVGGKTFGRLGAATTVNVSLTDLSGGANTAPQQGDIIVLAVAVGSNVATTSQSVSGYTTVANLFSDDTHDTTLWVGYKIMGPTPDTTVTIPASGNASLGPLFAQTVALQVWRNVAFDNFSVATNINGVLANPPPITTQYDESQVLVIGAGAHVDGTDTYSASYASNFLSVGANDTFDSTIGMGSVARPIAGLYDPPAFTFSGTSSTLNSWAAVTLSLRPKLVFKSLAYANNTFVYGGLDGVIATSTDGTNWTERSSGTTDIINTITHDGERFVFATDQGYLGTSTDGINWSSLLTPTYVGGRTLARLGSTLTTGLSLTSLAGGINNAPQSGDLVVIAVATGSINNRPQTVTGYTEITSAFDGDDFDTNLWVGYKIMGSTPDTSVTIPASGSVDDAQTVAIHVWRNVSYQKFVAPLDNSSNVFPNPLAITTTSSNSIVLVVGAGAHNSGTETYSASYANNFLSIGSNDTYDSTIGMGSVLISTPGVYDPPAFTFSDNDGDGSSSIGVTIVLNAGININPNVLTHKNKSYYSGGSSGSLNLLTQSSFNTLIEFALPTESSSITKQLNDGFYIKT